MWVDEIRLVPVGINEDFLGFDPQWQFVRKLDPSLAVENSLADGRCSSEELNEWKEDACGLSIVKIKQDSQNYNKRSQWTIVRDNVASQHHLWFENSFHQEND